jgi:hypothetical protein
VLSVYNTDLQKLWSPMGAACVVSRSHIPAETAVPNGSRVCCEEINKHLQRLQSPMGAAFVVSSLNTYLQGVRLPLGPVCVVSRLAKYL